MSDSAARNTSLPAPRSGARRLIGLPQAHGSAAAERARGFWRYWTVRHRHNWGQLTRFSIVGGSGYIVNLVVFAALITFGLYYIAAAVLAFGVANVNNYLWNRIWSFPRTGHNMMHEYMKFLTVGVVALGVNVALLGLFVERVGLAELHGQAIAVVLVTPIGFLGNKLWTFRTR